MRLNFLESSICKAMVLSAAFVLFASTGQTAEKGGAKVDTDIMATLSSNGYDYEVKVLVNGVDIGITGGKSEGKRLMHKNSEMAVKAPPDKRRQYFMLESNENTLTVDYKKTKNEPTSRLEIAIEADNYPAPIVLLHSSGKANGRFEKKFVVKSRAPQDFKPVFETDAGAGRSAFVQVNSTDTTVTPELNGEKAMAMGMPGAVVLDNAKAGKNELIVRYKGEKGAEADFTVVTPEGMTNIKKVLPDNKEHAETITFTAK